LGGDVGTSLLYTNSGRGISVAEVDEHLGGLPAECSRWSNWSEAKQTGYLCLYTRSLQRVAVI